MAAALRKGYSQLYERNEYAHDLDKKKLEGLVVEITGLEQGHATVRAIVGTFEALKGFADFNKPEPKPADDGKDKGLADKKVLLEKHGTGDAQEDLKLNSHTRSTWFCQRPTTCLSSTQYLKACVRICCESSTK